MSKGKFAKGAFLGALIGASLGLLYAPATGDATRKKLKAEADKLQKKPEVKKAIDKAKAVSKKVTPIVKKELKKANTFLNALGMEIAKNKKKSK